MGYMSHHTIVVCSWDERKLSQAHETASKLFLGHLVSPIVFGTSNGFRSFFIAPDGSKEGWPESKQFDIAREEFVKYCRSQAYSDHSTALDYVEVQFGDDEHECKILNASDIDQREVGVQS